VELYLGFRLRLHDVLRSATQRLFFFTSASLSRHDVSSRLDEGERALNRVSQPLVYTK